MLESRGLYSRTSQTTATDEISEPIVASVGPATHALAYCSSPVPIRFAVLIQSAVLIRFAVPISVRSTSFGSQCSQYSFSPPFPLSEIQPITGEYMPGDSPASHPQRL